MNPSLPLLKKYCLLFLLSAFIYACQQSKLKPQPNLNQRHRATTKVPTPQRSFLIIQLGPMQKEFVKETETLLKQNYPNTLISTSYAALPQSAITKIKTTRYRADSLIHQFVPTSKNEYTILITEQDISTTKNKEPKKRYADWGVMGLGYMPGNACIASTYRLKHKSKAITIARFRKVVIHEVGHCLGLPHCATMHCVMSDANESINTIDQEGESFCATCKTILTK